MKRLSYLDTARGICMFFVISGHLLPNGIIKTFICSFHLSTFFIISGLIFKRNNEQQINLIIYMKKTFQRILLPYLFFCVIYMMVDYCLLGNIDISYYIKSIISFSGLSVLWFFPCICFSKLLFYCIQKYFNEGIACIIIFIIAITSILYGSVKYDLLLILSRVGIAVSFIWIGYNLEKMITDYSIVKFESLIASILLFFGFSQINGIVDLYSLMFNNITLYYFIAILGGVLCIQISKYFNYKIISEVGIESTYILAISQILIKIMQFFDSNKVYMSNSLVAILLAILILLISLMICKLYRNLIKYKNNYKKGVRLL